MTDNSGNSLNKQPLWLTVFNFPLVAMLVALALVVAMIFAAGAALGRLPTVMDANLAIAIQGVVAVALVFLVYKAAIRQLGARKHDDLPLAPALGQLAAGFGIGFVLMTLIVGIAALAGAYRITGWGSGADAVLILFSGGLFAGFVEEVLFRGILFRWFEEMLGSWAALAITSALFGLAHYGNANATLFSSIAIAFEAGILLGAAYMLTRSLWLAVGLHMGWNITQGLIFAVPVSGHPMRGLVEAKISGPELLSGGAFGLEGSLIGLAVATLSGLWLLRLAIKRGRLVSPMWVKAA